MNLYLYFSGTGNTKYVVEQFSSNYEETEFKLYSIEANIKFAEEIQKAYTIILAYPIYESTMPFIMEDFLNKYEDSFKNKSLITIATQFLFSGDGGALAYYKLKKKNVRLLHSIHINMPSNLVDVNIFMNKPIEDCDKKIQKADQLIQQIVERIKCGKTIKHGRRFYSWIAGFFLQRVFAKLFTKKLRTGLKIHQDVCTRCGLCVKECPVDNLYMEKIVKTKDICTTCYRCINICPVSAISLFSKKQPRVQYKRDTYN